MIKTRPDPFLIQRLHDFLGFCFEPSTRRQVHAQINVGTVEIPHEDLRLSYMQALHDRLAHQQRRRRGQSQNPGKPERVDKLPQPQIVGTEIVPPLAHAMRLVHYEQGNARCPQHLHRCRLLQLFGREKYVLHFAFPSARTARALQKPAAWNSRPRPRGVLFRRSQTESCHVEPILLKLFNAVMQGEAMLPGVVHERFNRRLAKFGGASERNLLFPEQFERDQLRASFETSLPSPSFATGIPIRPPCKSLPDPEEKVQSFGENHSIGRPAQPAELAHAYVYPASDESSYVTGSVMALTGSDMLP
jgi:hypothetical protein